MSLFFGDHVPRVRFEQALERLDLDAAVQDCPGPWYAALDKMIAAGASKDPARIDLDRLLAARESGWPATLERAWQRLVGRRLDARRIPAIHDGQFAADFLRRGGELDQAAASMLRYLEEHPRDAPGWTALARIQPLPAAARAAFHGGNPPLAGLDRVVEALAEDEQPTDGPWLLPYAWLVGLVATTDLAVALDAERCVERPIPMPGSAAVFTFYLVEAEGVRRDAVGVPSTVIEARRRLKTVSPVAFRRYLARVATG